MDSADAFHERRMTIELLAPAKINLGLEIIRRRDDGYHDIATVMQTISIFDRVRISPAAEDDVRIAGQIHQIESNLASTALELVKQSGMTRENHRIEIDKRIPVAAGLGGASTDAAAVVRGLCPGQEPAWHECSTLALQLGSDVPFLLQGGAALATGRGEILESCPSLQDCWLVLASPALDIERKTATLYGALASSDFSDGSAAIRVASALQRRTVPEPGDLGNAFSRPLAHLMRGIAEMIERLYDAGAPFVALSGAGPTHYTIVPALSDANSIASRLARRPPIPMRVLIARPVPSGIQQRIYKTHGADFAL
jgi:4-diphosphocytidyl-2-C-methyl-D-erythritol kinase